MANEIEQKIGQLPEDVKKHLIDYIEFLAKKYSSKPTQEDEFRFDWEGGLSELKDKYTSVELQHKALEWR